MTDRPTRVFEIFIRSTPEQIWQALTDGALTPQYYVGARVESSWTIGAPYSYIMPDGVAVISGEILEIAPPRRLVTSFSPSFGTAEDAQPSKVTWAIEPTGPTCRVTVTHEGLAIASALTPQLVTGWAQILSGLKTLLETGEPLVITFEPS